MSLAKFINKILGRFDVAIVKKSSLERLAGGQQAALRGDEFAATLKEIKETLELNHKQQLRHQISAKWDMVDVFERDRILETELTCPLCGHHNGLSEFAKFVTNCIFGGGELIRYGCPACDVIFGPEKMLRLSEAELSRDYEWHYQVFTEGDSTAQEVRAFHALAPEKNGVYLNWGAGAWSDSTNILRQEGWNVYGYEPHGSASTGSPYFISDKAQLLTMQFDGIFSNNVLEHLRHPERELATMSSLLAKGGKMSHATPCFEYLYEFTRFHLFFFPGRSRAVLADKAGLRIDGFVSDGEFMNLILSPRAE
jgi:hypothetical protein